MSFADKMGALTLSGMNKPVEMDWYEYTIVVLNAAADAGRLNFFDLTHVQDLDNLLRGADRFAQSITAVELRHIQQNWTRFELIIRFYENGLEREAPWAVE